MAEVLCAEQAVVTAIAAAALCFAWPSFRESRPHLKETPVVLISGPEIPVIASHSEVPEKKPPLSAGKVAQRMKELSPLATAHLSRFHFKGVHTSHTSNGSDIEIGPSRVSLDKLGGNAWTNARNLVDFSAATTTANHNMSDASHYNEDSVDPVSSVLFWSHDNSYDSPVKSSRCSSGLGDDPSTGGVSPKKKLLSPMQPSSTARHTGRQQELMHSVAFNVALACTGRYYASPPESPFGNSSNSAYGSAVKKRGGQAVKHHCEDCMKSLGLEMIDDEYIINLKSMLGAYLSDSVRRFDVLVNMITEQLLTGNKISAAQVSTVKGLLGHTSERDPSPLLGLAETSGVSLSDIMSFCRRADVKDSLVVCDKASGIVSDLITEYEALLNLFRISGDHYSSHHMHVAAPSTADNPLINSSFAPGSIFQNVSANVESKSFYSSLYNKPGAPVVAAQPAPQLMGSPMGSMTDKDINHRATSSIISRAHFLASDDHFGRFTWYSYATVPSHYFSLYCKIISIGIPWEEGPPGIEMAT